MPDPIASSGGRRGAIAVVLRGDRFLVVKRSRHVVAPGKLCFPGGGIEPHESESQAVLREFQEELGTAVRPLKCVWRSATAWHVELAWWLCDLADQAQLSPDPAEIEAVHWFTAEEMLALADLLESNRQFLSALAAGQIALDA